VFLFRGASHGGVALFQARRRFSIPFIITKISAMTPYVQAFARWRIAPTHQRDRLLREQAGDDALIASFSAAFRLCNELSEAKLRRLPSPNGKTFADSTAAERSEMAVWAAGLRSATIERAAIVESLARATAKGAKI
jgi:hypothetical protein